jgi:MT-A70
MSSGYHLLDIPTSFTPTSFTPLVAYSSTAATQPRNPPQPKNKDAQWPQAEDLRKLHTRYGQLAETALKQAHDDGVKEWCKRRTEKDEEGNNEDIRQWHEMFQIMEKFGNANERNVIELSKGPLSLMSLTPGANERRLEQVHGQVIVNPFDKITKLALNLNPPQRYYIPARSSFVLDTFPSASSALTTYTLQTGRFDLITLDPPWHNKAVSRLKTKRHLAYNTMKDILTELPPVGNWLAPSGIVAIWCTNNLKMITKVKTILFKRWGVELVAEWVWLKVYSLLDVDQGYHAWCTGGEYVVLL